MSRQEMLREMVYHMSAKGAKIIAICQSWNLLLCELNGDDILIQTDRLGELRMRVNDGEEEYLTFMQMKGFRIN